MFAKALEKFLGGEVLVGGENKLHDGVTLRGLTETFGANERVEFFADGRRHHGDAPISN